MSEVTAAKDQRNPLNCENGWDECDHSKLTPLEVGQTASAVHQRNLFACRGDQHPAGLPATGDGQPLSSRIRSEGCIRRYALESRKRRCQ
jgi:hypothetical protein